jgi:signal transduction histidine kinase/HAMP domain-containing protein
MRWWLAAAFAGVAALTAVSVVAVLNTRSEQAFRKYAQDFAIGNAVTAAETLKRSDTRTTLRSTTDVLARRGRIAIFVFDARGRPLTPPVSNGAVWRSVPSHADARATALRGGRFIAGARDGSSILVGVRIHGGVGAVLVAYSLRPELSTQLGIVRNEFWSSALVAFVLGAAAGLLVAVLTARRLARIARVAQAIGGGDFTRPAVDRFPDEVGSLAGSIEHMRLQLQGVFEALNDDRTRLERLLDRLDEGVLLVNSEMRVEFVNRHTRELLGADDGVTDASLLEIPGSQTVRRFVEDVFGAAAPMQLTMSTEDGRSLLLTGIPPSRGADNVIIVIGDQSRRERAERAQRDFATNAAHELRTPLASIVTAIEMLQTGAKDDAEVRDEFLGVIEMEAGRLTRLTRALLVLARAEARDEMPTLSAVAVAPILRQVVASLAPREGVRLVIDCRSDVLVSGDSDLLEQALSNLALNAVQHTDAGTVTLRAQIVGDEVLVEVEDQGRGMERAHRARVFDRFYRRGENGAGFGLGLAIAQAAAQALGGTIEIDSTPGAGTIARMRLHAARTVEVV